MSAIKAQTAGKVCFVLHQVPQPWHPQGTYVHEAALAVRSVDEAKYEDYVTAVFTAFDGGKFKDDDTWNKTRQQVYDELLDMAKAVGVDRDAVKAKLAIKPEGGNCGNEMTQTIKWIVKHHRLRAVRTCCLLAPCLVGVTRLSAKSCTRPRRCHAHCVREWPGGRHCL